MKRPGHHFLSGPRFPCDQDRLIIRGDTPYKAYDVQYLRIPADNTAKVVLAVKLFFQNSHFTPHSKHLIDVIYNGAKPFRINRRGKKRIGTLLDGFNSVPVIVSQ
ncbi:MAG: hypothetical protein A4E57_03192 [Syntrophorhabdaceae bacterium PtaU1.Bin034]|nr:MAG: hypothetical protein A4E57_03192 [Syntrophorhabdaceae bacterium PtaU1.Bin034]